MIICYTVPKIWLVMDVIVFHFGTFFALLPPPKIKTSNINQQPKKSKLKKKTPKDIIILHMCTKNYNQMMYSS